MHPAGLVRVVSSVHGYHAAFVAPVGSLHLSRSTLQAAVLVPAESAGAASNYCS